MIVFGEAAEKIEAALDIECDRVKNVLRCCSMEEAVNIANEIVHPGYVVLLSPGCTSFDEFTDFSPMCFISAPF